MRKLTRKRVTARVEGESLTHQSERTRADINNIIKRGIVPPDPNQLQFGDFADGTDFQTVKQSIAEAESAFNALPSEIRDRFENDPASLIDFVNNPKNADEAQKMGLLIVDDSNRIPHKRGDEPEKKPEPDPVKPDASESKNVT